MGSKSDCVHSFLRASAEIFPAAERGETKVLMFLARAIIAKALPVVTKMLEPYCTEDDKEKLVQYRRGECSRQKGVCRTR